MKSPSGVWGSAPRFYSDLARIAYEEERIKAGVELYCKAGQSLIHGVTQARRRGARGDPAAGLCAVVYSRWGVP